ncbi:MAG: RNA polymerase sigma factor [Longimicrobiales bacterium]
MGTDPNQDTRFREVYDATFDEVRRFCLRRLPASDVNDAVSEVYLVAWQKADKVPPGEESLPWLYGVARNVVRHTDRSNRRRVRLTTKARREPVGTVAGPETHVVRRSEDEALIAGIGRLSLSDQEVVRLRAWEDLTAPAIALVLGCSVAAAEKRVARAFQRLEKTLAAARNSPTDLRATIPGKGGL